MDKKELLKYIEDNKEKEPMMNIVCHYLHPFGVNDNGMIHYEYKTEKLVLIKPYTGYENKVNKWDSLIHNIMTNWGGVRGIDYQVELVRI